MHVGASKFIERSCLTVSEECEAKLSMKQSEGCRN